MHTTLALSHLALGLGTTRAHDVFYDPESGVAAPYGHHPPALALLVAAFFALAGSATPAVARLVVIACHLGSLILLMGILEHLVSRGAAVLGGLVFATLPMSAYFGRMVNYEPVCLFGVMLALGGWLALRRDGPPHGRARLIAGFAFGGLVDWAAFFFAGALALAEAPDAWRGRRGSRLVVISVSATAALIMALNLWHLWWANRGSLAPLWEVVPGPVEHLSLFELVARPVETFRLYFTHAGLLASFAVLGSLLYRRTAVPRLLEGPDPASLRRYLVVAGSAGLGYVVAGASWAARHPYWQFYLLPFVVTALVLGVRWAWRYPSDVRFPPARIVVALLMIEMLVTSAHMLHLRHTKIGTYATGTTASFRTRYLAPGPHGEVPARVPVAPEWRQTRPEGGPTIGEGRRSTPR